MIAQLLSEEAQAFIQTHEGDDVASLMLQGKKWPKLPLALLAAQITSRQKAKTKLPEWYAAPKIIFPTGVPMEQCTSQEVAQHKSSFIQGHELLDLTGGSGIDTYYLSRNFQQAYYVEQNPELAELARHNFAVLGAKHIGVMSGRAEEYIKNLKDFPDVVYIDPARRDEANRKMHGFADCSPDVVNLVPTLLEKAQHIWIKSSPLLDISLGIQQLKKVEDVYVLSWENECKEVLFHISPQGNEMPSVHALNWRKGEEERLSFSIEEEKACEVPMGNPERYLYEPNAAVLKAGAFKTIGARYQLDKLHQHTHLYTSAHLLMDFPGRVFEVLDKVKLNRKALEAIFPTYKAHVMVRNYPLSVADIRKKTGLKEGGNDYLIGCTSLQGPEVYHTLRLK
ncbi:RsmD family RNA methyltransferase [Cytophagales bacterium LB-30]|uniref:RsmD family RNA methyltransferase n=1 Tax=Shiella aurantiaca TaxID=3058365 RepID=A0ABT8F6K4_9BACT|nr:RsmD family RNA methyltransferase [Shiella aurantiaca]MDN4166102.1 RsmD family RNA methyltransferase [Shiella aurantiaca]